MAYNEVVVALIHEPGSVPVLRQFARRIALVTVSLLALLVASPLAGLWFDHGMNLSPEVAKAARIGAALALLMPAYQVTQSWYQGVIVASGRTRAIPEAVALYSLLAGLLCWIGTQFVDMTGLFYTVIAFSCGGVAQTFWLGVRSREAIRGRVLLDEQARQAG